MPRRSSDGGAPSAVHSSWDANLRLADTRLVLCRRIIVGADGFKSQAAIPREDFGQWLGDIMAL